MGIPGWTKKSGCNVYATTAIDGVCDTAYKTLAEATQICADAGARLCTKDELLASCAAGTGCDADRRLCWTSTPEI